MEKVHFAWRYGFTGFISYIQHNDKYVDDKKEINGILKE